MQRAPEDSIVHDGADRRPDGRTALRRLDDLLARAVRTARQAYGPDAAVDAFRGLYVSPDQAAQSLDGVTGEPTLGGPGSGLDPEWDEIVADEPGWAWLRDAYRLTDRELDLALVAFGPDVDLRYERVYGYLHDDVSRRRPTVDLALNLLTTTAAEKRAARALVAADAPLVSRGVVELVADPSAVRPPLLAQVLKLDEQIVDVLLGQTGLDRRLAPYCRLATPPSGLADPLIPAESRDALVTFVATAWGVRPLRLYFHGPKDAGSHQAAEALAGELGAPLLSAGLAQLAPAGPDVLRLLFREAWLHGALLYLDDLDDFPHRAALAVELAKHPGVTILAGRVGWTPLGDEPLGVHVVSFGLPGYPRRRQLWAETLAAYGAILAPGDLDALAERYRLGPVRIRDAVLAAYHATQWQSAVARDAGEPGAVELPVPSLSDLSAAARGQAGHELAALARKIEPGYGWADIVLPADARAQLREVCERVAHRQQVMGEWGFGRKLSQGKGVSAMFAGPPGTGKTMAAEVIAREVGLDLYKIDLAAVISKYIGETEKNLERIFTAAADANAILFFDEADALFGKRSEIRDSHDRYANIEVAYLLQRMEQYDGLAILATNLRQHIDEAFTRRLQFVVEFPFPDEADRERIWQTCFPAAAPRDPSIDFASLAARFRLSGANINNVVLAAAFLAATDGARIEVGHLLTATRREYQKMGKLISEAQP